MLLDSGCAALEKREDSLLFLFPQNLACCGISFQGNLSLDSEFNHAVPATTQAPRVQGGGRSPSPACVPSMWLAQGPGTLAVPVLTTQELDRALRECRRELPSSWALSASRRHGPCWPRNSGSESEMRPLWKHIPGPGSV